MSFTAKNIKKALSNALPGSLSHKKMLPLNRVLKVPPADTGRLKHSSVLLLLFVDNGKLCCVLIKRPVHMKHHAGQIALPGGRIEKGETALQTALRETREEIGITSDKIEILGILSDFYIEVSRFQIHPFVGWLKQKPWFILNPDEVEKTVIFPIAKFHSNMEQAELETLTGKLTVPCIRFENEIVWGATAMILAEFRDVLENAKFIFQ
jgi:8-oxo-dGTP pyrophosphatase MutT (NUDIX family)